MNTTTPDEAADVRAKAERVFAGPSAYPSMDGYRPRPMHPMLVEDLEAVARAYLSQRAELARLRKELAEMAAALEPFTELDRNIGGEWGAECERLRAAMARHAATNAGEERKVPCTAIGPHHRDPCQNGRVQSPNSQFWRDCTVCRGTGYTLEPLFAKDKP